MTDAPLDGNVSAACFDDETIGSFVDGTIDPEGRKRVAEHVASCADCYELVAEVVRADVDLAKDGRVEPPVPFPVSSPTPGRTASPLASRRGFVAASGILAVAASLFFVIVNRGSQLDSLIEVVGNERLTLARPTGGFHYGPLRSPMRGSREVQSLQLQAVMLQLQERAERTNAPADLHGAGVAQMLDGNIDASVSALQSAAQAEPRNARFKADLGGAMMTRFVNKGDQADATAALATLDEALALSPSLHEPLFNKALLLQQLDRLPEAIAAWDRYLTASAEPEWREEAIRNREAALRKSGSHRGSGSRSVPTEFSIHAVFLARQFAVAKSVGPSVSGSRL